MRPKGPVNVLDRFGEERQRLLTLLSGLSPEQWQAPTPCPDWSVKDLTAHILADDLGNLSGGRDGFDGPANCDLSNWGELVAFINERNEEWVRATRRLSPQVLIELLSSSGDRVLDHFRSLDPLALGAPVSWAGPQPAPRWLHVAREYTERWLHQQQVREAVGAPGLFERRLFAPVLDTFVHALPRTYSEVSAPEGAHVRVVISGDAGGAWSLVHHEGAWRLFEEIAAEATAEVALDEDTAWRLFTKGISRGAARKRMRRSGDERLALVALDTVAIIA
ncbi:MAG: maleylpyruvate isomerase family mycothiol-dependent enzyme [Dehalococcoidia bacterium]